MGIPTHNMAGAAQNGANGDANGAPSSYAAKFNLAPHFIGGNELRHASPGKVKDFVAAHDGHTVITNVRESRGSGIRGVG
jgi:acetyl-CoA carboxylase/biotin carboxylase 1